MRIVRQKISLNRPSTLSNQTGPPLGSSADSAQTGAVTLIQRFGRALNLNIHYHMLFLDGVYLDTDAGPVADCVTRRALMGPRADRHVGKTWAQRLKRVFKIGIETCETCSRAMKVIAGIEAPAVIKRILAHLDNRLSSLKFH